jgi:hypothetical protein
MSIRADVVSERFYPPKADTSEVCKGRPRMSEDIAFALIDHKI